jgi:hypothetical protein
MCGANFNLTVSYNPPAERKSYIKKLKQPELKGRLFTGIPALTEIPAPVIAIIRFEELKALARISIATFSPESFFPISSKFIDFIVKQKKIEKLKFLFTVAKCSKLKKYVKLNRKSVSIGNRVRTIARG